MAKSKLDSTKSILEDEIKMHVYTRDNLYSNAASSRKIEDYIIESVISNVNKGDCLDWLASLLKQYEVPQDNIDEARSSAELQFSILDKAINSRLKQKK